MERYPTWPSIPIKARAQHVQGLTFPSRAKPNADEEEQGEEDRYRRGQGIRRGSDVAAKGPRRSD